MQANFRSILVSSAGNLLEWYDFGLFAAFSILFSRLFFPNTDPHIALIQVLGIYASGFFCRPLGAVIFGYLGDHLGRVKTLRLAICFMSLPTLLIAFVPTYDTIGFYAPLILVLLRMLQGISLGGEFTGIIIYLTEFAPPKRRALYVSLVGSFTTLGFLSATAMVLLLEQVLNTDQLSQYGWRVAFAAGALLGGLILYWQRKLPETSAFLHAKAGMPKKLSFFKLLQKAKGKMLFTMSLVILNAVFYYVCFVYMHDLLAQLHFSEKFIGMAEVISFSAMLFLVPVGGFICDKIGRRNSFLIISGSLAVLSPLCFKALASGHLLWVISALLIFTLLSSFEQGTTSVTVAEQFSAKTRYSGVSISYNITQALFGGTAPMFAAWLAFITHNPLAPGYYVTLVAVITFCSAYFFLKDSRFVDLDQ